MDTALTSGPTPNLTPMIIRELTPDEVGILREGQAIWGEQNRASDVFLTVDDEAVLWARDSTGNQRVMVNLTNHRNVEGIGRTLHRGAWSLDLR